jgi:hypothetical protein
MEWLRAWISRWGFAALVGVAIVAGIAVAATVAPPADIPAVALQAAVVYRLEVGGALFLGLYLVAMVFILALQNRGFSEIGPGGVRAQDLNDVSETVAAQEGSMKLLLRVVDELRDVRDEPGED